jgi:ATP-binding cassette subfamily F protein uup
LLGEIPTLSGKRVQGVTVKPGVLSQHLSELDESKTVIATVEAVANYIDLGKGKQLSASQVCQRLGFDHDGQFTRVAELSGGERRRLELTRILMAEPNILALDEPTNDFDVETLAALEDLLDGFPGSLLVISHDRYFLERVCDSFVAVLGDGKLTDLPRGLDQYLELRALMNKSGGAGRDQSKRSSDPARDRELRKKIDKYERQLAKVDDEISGIHNQMAQAAGEYTRLGELDVSLREIITKREAIEEQWLQVATELAD